MAVTARMICLCGSLVSWPAEDMRQTLQRAVDWGFDVRGFVQCPACAAGVAPAAILPEPATQPVLPLFEVTG